MFSASCGSWGWGGGRMWVGVGWGLPPTHVHMYAHAHTCMHAHAFVVNMVISCKWPPQLDLGKSRGFPMMSYMCVCRCACVHVCACACGWGAPSYHPSSPSTHPPTHPTGGTPGIIQNSIALELIQIFRFFLKISNLWRLPHPWVGV